MLRGFKSYPKQTVIVFFVILGILASGFSANLLAVSPAIPVQQSADHYYLAHWEWFEGDGISYWRAPRGEKFADAVDLRPLIFQGKTGGEPEGYGFFVYNQKVTIPDSIYLGHNLKEEMRNRQEVAKVLDVELHSETILDFLWSMFTVYSDPLGQIGPKPLMPNENLELELYLGGRLVKSEPFDIFTHPHREKVIAVLQNTYRSERESDRARGSTHYLKVLGGWMEKYGVQDHTLFLPPDVPDEGWLQPETTITDNFNTDTSANWTADGGTFTIDATDSNVFQCTGVECVVRYSATALSTKDHYAQVKVLETGGNYHGPMIRKANSATLTYYTHLFQGPGNPITQLFKRVAGSYTQIGGNYSHTHVSGDVYKIKAAGTTITTYVNGVEAHSQTDSAIDEQFNAGIVSAVAAATFDDFQASDNNTTPASPTSATQLKTDDTTTISNGGYTPQTSVNLKASVTDADTTETITLYFELVANADSFTSTSTPVVGESCASGTAYASCSSKVWYITSASGNYSSTAFTATSTVATLTNATGYKWQVKGCDDDNACSAWVAFNASTPNFTVDTTVPSTPGTPSTTSPTTDTTPTWTWTASTDGGSGLHATTPYWVEWSTNANFTSGVSSSTASTNSFTHSSALSDNTYYSRIRALDAVSNESSYSASSTVVVDTTAPSTPGTPSTTSPTTDTTPTWTWTASTDGGSGLHATTPYWVEWSTNANFTSGVSSSTASTNSFTHSSALSDNTYYSRIRALDAVSNESSYSASSTVVVDTTAPSTPGTPSTTSPTTDTTPAWTWTASTDGGSGLHATTPYWVEWSTNANFTSGVSSSTAATASFTHSTDLTDETTWYFRVKTLDVASNESSFSSNGSVAVDTTPPPGPGPSTAGGSAAAETAFLQQQGFLPQEPEPTPPPPSLIERIVEPFMPFIPSFLLPPPPAGGPEPEPIPAEEFPQKPPLAFQGQWNLLGQRPIKEFVLSSLPEGLLNLASKFPQLSNVFDQVGISKITDLQRLKTVKLTLPGFSQLTHGIPSEIVFTTIQPNQGKRIDMPATLSVTDQGDPQQKITTIVGYPLHLMVKPEQPVQRIKGYVVFRSKETSQLPLSVNPLLASALAANPTLAQAHDFKDGETRLVLLEFEYTDPDQDGLYSADIVSPAVDGEYEIITVVEYQDPEVGIKAIRLLTVVDPEGYVYELSGRGEVRIPGATVSLYSWNSQSGRYELWPAADYQQENPQVTDNTGTYSFLVPEGSYYISVRASGYLPYQGETFEVREGSPVQEDIQLKSSSWWLRIWDWRVIVSVVFGFLLLLNFWRDKILRRKVSKN